MDRHAYLNGYRNKTAEEATLVTTQDPKFANRRKNLALTGAATKGVIGGGIGGAGLGAAGGAIQDIKAALKAGESLKGVGGNTLFAKWKNLSNMSRGGIKGGAIGATALGTLALATKLMSMKYREYQGLDPVLDTKAVAK